MAQSACVIVQNEMFLLIHGLFQLLIVVVINMENILQSITIKNMFF